MALELRADCERCGRDLPPDAAGAMICSFECTFCADCAAGPLGVRCPNCGGNFEPRPRRVGAALARFPASGERRFGGWGETLGGRRAECRVPKRVTDQSDSCVVG